MKLLAQYILVGEKNPRPLSLPPPSTPKKELLLPPTLNSPTVYRALAWRAIPLPHHVPIQAALNTTNTIRPTAAK